MNPIRATVLIVLLAVSWTAVVAGVAAWRKSFDLPLGFSTAADQKRLQRTQNYAVITAVLAGLLTLAASSGLPWKRRVLWLCGAIVSILFYSFSVLHFLYVISRAHIT